MALTFISATSRLAIQPVSFSEIWIRYQSPSSPVTASCWSLPAEAMTAVSAPAPPCTLAEASLTVTSLLVTTICGGGRLSTGSLISSVSMAFMPVSRMRNRSGICASARSRRTARFTRAVFVSSGASAPRVAVPLVMASPWVTALVTSTRVSRAATGPTFRSVSRRSTASPF